MGHGEDETTAIERASDNARLQPITGRGFSRQFIKLGQGAKNSATGHGCFNLRLPFQLYLSLATQTLHRALLLLFARLLVTPARLQDCYSPCRWGRADEAARHQSALTLAAPFLADRFPEDGATHVTQGLGHAQSMFHALPMTRRPDRVQSSRTVLYCLGV